MNNNFQYLVALASEIKSREDFHSVFKSIVDSFANCELTIDQFHILSRLMDLIVEAI